MKKYKTEARPPPNNEIWEKKVHGNVLVAERPLYKFKKLEQELMLKGMFAESRKIYGETRTNVFDKEQRHWCHESLGSRKLIELFTKNPVLYMKVIANKVQTIKRIIATMKEVNEELYTHNPKKLLENFRKLAKCWVGLYSYHAITYIVYDNLVLRFKQVLDSFLAKKESNEYFTEFIRAEITKEAIKVGSVGEGVATNRDIYYSDAEPVVFYKEPKLFIESKQDNKVLAKLHSLKPEIVEEFIALRQIVPVSIQISEEAQYIESKMLNPLLRITLENIKDIFIKGGIMKKQDDVRDFSQQEIEKALQILMVKKHQHVASGQGVSRGKARGTVRIINNIDDHAGFNEGDILVTRMTDPTMVVLMGKAAGIICDIGSITSHASVISRELGVPCIVDIENATKLLKDGNQIHMCGESGKIHLIQNEWRLKWE